ncbi:hypothetical protein [Rhizobium sp. CC-YZS058]|uniref:hypothetical protein n=1 Tax=Rhizobium sp. CC-YZS058 TaxID=3042153 RepID=UPI002B05B8A9|nr:hypothetical protein [Rhizobium sp. CC-YZS058]MEA3533433.1 hypothetical protein [Rhizobium sp. CC-YZS058]
MTGDRSREPYIAPSADAPHQVKKKAIAGKGLILGIACFAAVMFLLYISVVIYAAYKAG